MAAAVKRAPKAVGNLLVTIIFASLAVIDLLTGDYLGMSIWLGLAIALVVMGPESRRWRDIPGWRRIVGSVLLIASIVLFGLQIMRDFTS